MRLPNLFASSRGRLAAFFFLYMTEGIPLGFAATAVATQLRRQGVGPAEIGAFVASFYLPWVFKWMFGPVVDVFSSERLGRRRGWIIGTQLMMVITLLSTVLLDLPSQLGLFTAILLVHNTFAATQDVAIDALAVNTLLPGERATANGMMFAGANIGQMVGGSGALFLSKYIGFQSTFYFVAGSILMVTLFVVLPLKEAAGAPRVRAAGSALRAAGGQMRDFAVSAFRSFLGTRSAFAGLGMALLPPGAMCLGLALQTNLAVDLGLNDDQVAWLGIATTGLGAAGCVVGGRISDRIDRRSALNVFIVLMCASVLAMMGVLIHEGWVMPLAAGAPRPEVSTLLLYSFWASAIAYGFFQGLMYSATMAIYMDVTNPIVAGTQFTAYMAMSNLTINYSAIWQGIAIETWGYPGTMLVDAFFGLVFLAVLRFTKKRPGDPEGYSDAHADGRARGLARVLAVMCLLWLPVHTVQDQFGAAQAIVSKGFTLIFVGSLLFLLAGGTVLSAQKPRLAQFAQRFALLLLLPIIALNWIESISGWLAPVISPQRLAQAAEVAFYLIPLVASWLLWRLSRQAWETLQEPAATIDSREGTAPETGRMAGAG
jgi:PAT family beta-lactamase induction signal transducer AmpG